MLDWFLDLFRGDREFGATRSPLWRYVRAQHLKRNPTCAVCGGTEKLEVHHIRPFHINPELELNPNNLITLCESKKKGVTCHQFFGHLGDYRKVNLDVEVDAKVWNAKLRNDCGIPSVPV